MGQDIAYYPGSKEHKKRLKGEGWHVQGKVGSNKGVIGICLKDVSRHEPLPQGDISDIIQLEDV